VPCSTCRERFSSTVVFTRWMSGMFLQNFHASRDLNFRSLVLPLCPQRAVWRYRSRVKAVLTAFAFLIASASHAVVRFRQSFLRKNLCREPLRLQ